VTDGVMTPERELWACAIEIERQYGEAAPAFIAERIGALAMAGDVAGMARWKAIATCVDAMRADVSNPH
jgi:hypothetical protein